MALPNPSPGDTIAADNIDELRVHLTGQSGKTEAWHLRQSTGNTLITLATADGSNGFRLNDSAGVQVFYVDSDGNVTQAGTFSPGTLVLPNGATPSQTTEASAVWDTDDDVLTVGTGSATKVVGLKRGAGINASATQDLVFDTTAGALEVWNGSAIRNIFPTDFKYKTAAQVFTANTTYANVTATSGDLAVAIGASEVWLIECHMSVSFTSTGGLKVQLTGPAAPTAVSVTGTYGTIFTSAAADSIAVSGFGQVNSFSSNLFAVNAGTANGAFNTSTGTVIFAALVSNGVNAGTVTVQAAQNSAAGTTTINTSWIRAQRVA
jgi:hypothetical protein